MCTFLFLPALEAPCPSVEKACSNAMHTPSQRTYLAQTPLLKMLHAFTSSFASFSSPSPPVDACCSPPASSTIDRVPSSHSSFVCPSPSHVVVTHSLLSNVAARFARSQACDGPDDGCTVRSSPRPVVAFVLGSICSPVRTDLASFGCKNGSQTRFHVRSQSID